MRTPEKIRSIGFWTATAVVVANMIGTGVYTSIGFQARDLPSVFCILTLWVVGGVLAFCGALAYADLARAMPHSGGEYVYLSRLWHPLLGFLSGWVSTTVAFAAPMALAAMAFGGYVSAVFPGVSAKILAVLVLLGVAVTHALSRDKGAGFLNGSTVLKLLPMVVFIILGFSHSSIPSFHLWPRVGEWMLIFSPGFAVALVYVSYAYSGWNASTYLAGEVDEAEHTVPRSLLGGTATVTLLYVLVNAVFLRLVPLERVAGVLQPGDLAAEAMWGPLGHSLMSLFIGLGLLSSVSSLLLAGSRMTAVLGESLPRLSFFGRSQVRGNPLGAIALQTLLALIMVWTSTFDQVLTYIGFTLTLFCMAAVAGVFRLPGGSSLKGRWAAGIFLTFNLWMVVHLLQSRTKESLAGLATLVVGAALYPILKASEPLHGTLKGEK